MIYCGNALVRYQGSQPWTSVIVRNYPKQKTSPGHEVRERSALQLSVNFGVVVDLSSVDLEHQKITSAPLRAG